jgi:hypothetical protein
MASASVEAAHSRGDLITATSAALLGVAWLVVLLRLYVRVLLVKNFGWDDAVMVVAAVCSASNIGLQSIADQTQISYTVYIAVQFILVEFGFGNPHLLSSPIAIINKAVTVSSRSITRLALYTS